MAKLRVPKRTEKALPREDAVLLQYALWHPGHRHPTEGLCMLCAQCSGGCGNQVLPIAG